MNSEQVLTFDELGLSAGQRVHIHPDPKDPKTRFDCTLVGCLPEQSVILGTSPEGLAFPVLQEGQEVVIRISMTNGFAFFSSTVLFISDVPAFIVYLDLPTRVSFKQVRQSTRINISLPILLSNINNSSIRSESGRMVDISLGGAKIEMANDIGSIGDEIELKGKFQIGELKRICSVSAVICSRNVVSAQKYVFGLKISDVDEDNLIVLLGYTYSAMANGREQTIK